MEHAVVNPIRNLTIGEVQSHRNVAIAPVFGNDEGLDYIVLAEASKADFDIRENPKGPEVPQLYVANRTGKKVLAIVGEYVEGGSQNRTFSRSVLFSEDFEGMVPVKCVEAGRWTGHTADEPFGSSGVTSRYSATALDQMASWSDSGMSLSLSGSDSPTGDIGEAYRSRAKDFDEFKGNFSRLDGEIGAVASVIRGKQKLFVADVFDRSSTFEKYYDNLVRSYILEGGLESEERVSLTGAEAKGFLDSVDSCTLTRAHAISDGNDYDLKGEALKGSILSWEGGLIYANLLTPKGPSDEDGETHRTGLTRPL